MTDFKQSLIDKLMAKKLEKYKGFKLDPDDTGFNDGINAAISIIHQHQQAQGNFPLQMFKLAERMIECGNITPWHWIKERAIAAMGDASTSTKEEVTSPASEWQKEGTLRGINKPACSEIRLQWRDGYPPHPWDKEWFIALTTYGDRVVLKALPEEYTYDFKTADDTYIKKDKIAKWMQFPDSNYIEPNPVDAAMFNDIWNNMNELPGMVRKQLSIYAMREIISYVIGKVNPYLRTPEPVSVNQIAKTISNDQGSLSPHFTNETIVRTVVDAAGLSYAD